MKWIEIPDVPFTKLGVGNLYIEKYLNNLGVNLEIYNLLLNPPKENDGQTMHGMKELIPALLKDISENKQITIVGDYDCDGVTSTTILYEALTHLGGKVDYIIPHRIKDGYGLNVSMIERIKDKTQVIITCDNGISAHEAIDKAREYGMTVYITDHHTPGAILPNANIIVHPALPGYPFAEISGATVTYKVAKELLKHKPDEELSTYILQLAAISVVSDVMPVASLTLDKMKVNENRGILIRGLDSMKTEINWRLKILTEIMAIDISQMDETTIGFYISPVINAVGRIDDASEAVSFLTSKTRDEAVLKCSIMAYLNEQRKVLKTQYLAEVKNIVKTDKASIIVKHETIHEGLIGIIAGNLAEEYAKPCVVFAPVEVELDTGCKVKAWKASSRSNTVNLYDCLSKVEANHPNTIYRFGGHAGAAGLTVLDSYFDDFEFYFNEIVEEIASSDDIIKTYLSVPAQMIDSLGDAIEKLKPFGNGFPKPIIRTTMFVEQVDIFNYSKHVKLSSPYIRASYSEKGTSSELWLFGVAVKFKKSGLLDNFKEVMNNAEKLVVEKGLSPEEAEEIKWQRFKSESRECNLKLDMMLELDYGSFQGKTKTQTRVISYKKMI